MVNYYQDSLNASKLFQVYDTAYPRVLQYLAAEIDFVRGLLRGGERVLEVGAGYGRILRQLADHAASLTGVDISPETVALGTEYLADRPNCALQVMDAHALPYREEFDMVLCLQNGLSALGGDPVALIRRCLEALAPGGTALFSSYSPRFWPDRLRWFLEQAEKGLIGEIDPDKTGDGVITGIDGFRAVTFAPEALEELGAASGCKYRVQEVDGSSLFLILEAPEA